MHLADKPGLLLPLGQKLKGFLSPGHGKSMGDEFVELRLNPGITKRPQDVFSMVEVHIEVSADLLVSPAQS